MSVFVNVLEEVIVKEVYAQIDELRADLQPKVQVAEVLAYTLNRLPPLFSTSVMGWKYNYDYALNELHPRITTLIKRGNQIVLFGDPLHDSRPLPNNLFNNSAGVLYQLGQLLGRKYLRWREVPDLVTKLVNNSFYKENTNDPQLLTVIQSDDETTIQSVSYLSESQKSQLLSSKKFISKSSQRRPNTLTNGAKSWADEKKLRDALEMEQRALKNYTLQAELGMVNVLEHLVFLAIEKCTTPELFQQINRDEVAAYTLNRLPPMYATSMRGFRHLRQRAISELPRTLIGETRNGILKVLQVSHSDLPKIPNYEFIQEYDQAILIIQRILGRTDISLQNIVTIVDELMRSPVLSQ